MKKMPKKPVLSIPELIKMARQIANGLVSVQANLLRVGKLWCDAELKIKKLEAKIKKLESKK